MRRIIFVGLVIITILSTTPVQGAQFMGGYGLIHTNSALGMQTGRLGVSNYIRGFAGLVDKDGGYTVSNATSAIATSLGFSRNLEIGITQIVYQNLNLTKAGKDGDLKVSMIPGDTYFRLKFVGHQFTPNLFWGLMPNLHFQVGKHHDVQFEPLSSNSIEAELVFLLSYFQKPLYPDDGLSIHLNLGITNTGKSDTYRTGQISSSNQAIGFAIGFLQPRSNALDFGAEIFGSFFISQPSEALFARENWVYITPMLKYDMFAGLKLILGLDILVLGSENTTDYSLITHLQEYEETLDAHANYSSWRLTSRITYTPSKIFFTEDTFKRARKSSSPKRQKRSFDRRSSSSGGGDRQSLFRWAVEERGGEIEAIVIDLAKIRQERKNAEAELERLKKDLEKSNKK